MSIENISKNHESLLQSGRVELVCGDGRQGLEEHAPYDAIHVGAASPEYTRDALIAQLKVGGELVIPVQEQYGQVFYNYVKISETQYEILESTPVRYVPLCSEQEQRNRQW